MAVILNTHTHITLHSTILKGFNAEFMRWHPTNKVGGFLLRGFGLRFMLYRDKVS